MFYTKIYKNYNGQLPVSQQERKYQCILNVQKRWTKAKETLTKYKKKLEACGKKILK